MTSQGVLRSLLLVWVLVGGCPPSLDTGYSSLSPQHLVRERRKSSPCWKQSERGRHGSSWWSRCAGIALFFVLQQVHHMLRLWSLNV